MAAARRSKRDQSRTQARQNRSALIRDALRDHLKRLSLREAEARDRRGYADQPSEDLRVWERIAAWPED